MSQAPHLPPRPHQQERKLKEFVVFVLFVVLLASAAGIAAAAVSITWLIPAVPASRSIFTYFQNTKSNEKSTSLSMDDQKNFKGKIVKIFDKRKKLSGNFYDASGFVGNATLLTLDGWAVLYVPNVSQDISMLEAVDSQGRTHVIKKIVRSETGGLSYVQIDGEGFSVVSLFSGVPASQKIVWSYKDNEFFETELLFPLTKTKEVARSIVLFSPKISPVAMGSEFVVNEKAELIGFIDKNGSLLSAGDINRELRLVQKNLPLENTLFALTGYVLEGIEKDEHGVPQTHFGFFVTESGIRGKTGVMNGDIVVSVQNKLFDPKTVREDILNAPGEVVLTVLRQGKTVEVKVKKS